MTTCKSSAAATYSVSASGAQEGAARLKRKASYSKTVINYPKTVLSMHFDWTGGIA